MREAGLSFESAQMANQKIDMLPPAPAWHAVCIKFDTYQTEEPIIFYYRKADECVEQLFNNPMFADKMELVPVKHYTSDGKRVFTGPLSAEQAWTAQVCVLSVLAPLN